MVVGFLAAILMPERPLRERAGLSDAMEEQAVTSSMPGPSSTAPSEAWAPRATDTGTAAT